MEFAWQARHLGLSTGVRAGVPWAPGLCACNLRGRCGSWCSPRGVMYSLGSGALCLEFAWQARHVPLLSFLPLFLTNYYNYSPHTYTHTLTHSLTTHHITHSHTHIIHFLAHSLIQYSPYTLTHSIIHYSPHNSLTHSLTQYNHHILIQCSVIYQVGHSEHWLVAANFVQQLMMQSTHFIFAVAVDRAVGS